MLDWLVRRTGCAHQSTVPSTRFHASAKVRPAAQGARRTNPGLRVRYCRVAGRHVETVWSCSRQYGGTSVIGQDYCWTKHFLMGSLVAILLPSSLGWAVLCGDWDGLGAGRGRSTLHDPTRPCTMRETCGLLRVATGLAMARLTLKFRYRNPEIAAGKEHRDMRLE